MKVKYQQRADGMFRLMDDRWVALAPATTMTAEDWERRGQETRARIVRQLAIKQRFEFGDET